MTRSVRNLAIVQAVVVVGIVVIGSAAGWTASDYTVALLVVCGVALFATAAAVGRSGAHSQGGAMTDPIARGSVSGPPAAMVGIELAVDDDPSVAPDLPSESVLATRAFPLVQAGVAVTSGIAALVSWVAFG